MKKILLTVLAVTILAAYALATYGFGMRTETTARAWVDALPGAAPYLKVVRNDYDRGFLKSTHNVELQAALPGMDSPLAITLRNNVEHGPFPGFDSVGAARVTHTLVLPPEVQQALATVLGDRPPLTAVTTLRFAGGGSTRITGPAFTFRDERGEASWQGLEATVDVGKDQQRVAYTLAAPGFAAKMVDGSQVQVGRITATGAQDKLAGTESVYLGSSSITVQSIAVSGGPAATVALTNIAYAGEAKSPLASFVDMGGKLTVQNIKIANEDWGALEYSARARHLHAASLEAFGRASREAYGAPARAAPNAPQPQSAAQMQAAMLDAIKKHGGTLLKNEPVIEIEKLRFGSEREYLSVNGDARFSGVTDADAAAPMQLIPKISARLDIVLAETLLTRIAARAPRAPGRSERNADSIAGGGAPDSDTLLMVNAQVESAVAQGYLIREQGTLRATITFAAGKLLVNGRALDAMQ
jgi:uncharacterized protein YdgA (DUF945 family)